MAVPPASRLTTSISDAAQAFRKWMRGLSAGALLSLAIEIAPVPAARPRVSKWGTYYPKRYATWMKEALPFADAYRGEKVTGPLIVIIEQVVERAKTSKRDFPIGDCDNHAKGPLDTLTKSERVWDDDDQVVGLAIFKRFAMPGEKPGSYINIIKLER